MEFTDRILKCSDCGNEFVFTAGEQLFFFDKQFKNDPKRCKLCKAKRAGLGRTVNGEPRAIALPLSRTETRTKCSACGVETTVPFKPTQGRPVLCRSCFQLKRVPAAVAAVARMDSPASQVAEAVEQTLASAHPTTSPTTPGTTTAPSPSSLPSTSGTMDLVAQTPAPVVAEAAETSSALVAAAAEAPQA